MAIKYDDNAKLELWVKDTGELDGYAIYINELRRREVGTGDLKIFPIKRPTQRMSVAVKFGGIDGGLSVIVDNQGEGDQAVLEKHVGLSHVYEIEP